MIRFLKIIFFVVLFIAIRLYISKLLGKRAINIIFTQTKVKNDERHNKNFFNKRIIKLFYTFFIGFFISLLNGEGLLSSFIFGIVFLLIFLGYRAAKKNFIKKQVLQDLLNVSECLRVQISSQITLGSALRALPELCINKEFGSLLTNIYLEYELSKYLIIESGNALIDRFNYPEIRIFISAVNQQIQGTSAVEAFDNLIEVLKEEYIQFMEDTTKSKMAIMTIGVFIIVINIAIIGVYPVAVEALNAINIMLK